MLSMESVTYKKGEKYYPWKMLSFAQKVKLGILE